jgi:hypothetical protein
VTPHPDSTDLEKAIRARKAARAAALDPGTKLLAGAKLFDQVRARALCGIRTRHPEWTEAEVEAEFCRHLAARRARARTGFTPPPPPQGSGRPLPSNDGGNPRRTPAVSTARAIASDRA